MSAPNSQASSSGRSTSPTVIQYYSDDKGWIELDPATPMADQPINGTWFSVEESSAGSGVRAMRIGTSTKLQAGQQQQQSFIISSGPQAGPVESPVHAMIIKTNHPIEAVPPPPNFGSSPNPLLNQSWPPAFMTQDQDATVKPYDHESHNIAHSYSAERQLDWLPGRGVLHTIPHPPPPLRSLPLEYQFNHSSDSNNSATQFDSHASGDGSSSDQANNFEALRLYNKHKNLPCRNNLHRFNQSSIVFYHNWPSNVFCPCAVAPGRSFHAIASFPTQCNMLWSSPIPMRYHVPTRCGVRNSSASLFHDLRSVVVSDQSMQTDSPSSVTMQTRGGFLDVSITEHSHWAAPVLEPVEIRDGGVGRRASSDSSESILTTFVKQASVEVNGRLKAVSAN